MAPSPRADLPLSERERPPGARDRPPAEPGAEWWLPEDRSLPELRAAVQQCQGCQLHKRATQAVFGAGPAQASLVLVGEQPGHEEDLRGAPFVGPAGRVLDQALQAAGIDRNAVYVTNAVKHFKWESRGKRRLHGKPVYREIAACRPWLEAELATLRPRVLVCLGATAAHSLFGSGFKVSRDHGVPVECPWAPHAMATLHPSAVLRQRSAEARAALLADLVTDLSRAAQWLRG